jgi:hypothetical protein
MGQSSRTLGGDQGIALGRRSTGNLEIEMCNNERRCALLRLDFLRPAKHLQYTQNMAQSPDDGLTRTPRFSHPTKATLPHRSSASRLALTAVCGPTFPRFGRFLSLANEALLGRNQPRVQL